MVDIKQYLNDSFKCTVVLGENCRVLGCIGMNLNFIKNKEALRKKAELKSFAKRCNLINKNNPNKERHQASSEIIKRLMSMNIDDCKQDLTINLTYSD